MRLKARCERRNDWSKGVLTLGRVSDATIKGTSRPTLWPRNKASSAVRGYDILMQRLDLCWMVTIKPSRSELPVFKRYAFQTATQSEREALALAKRRIDQALETSKLTYSATRH